MKTDHLNTSSARAFLGTWSLESFTEHSETAGPTQPLGPNPAGLLIYTAEGVVSAQLMRSGRCQLSADAWDRTSSAGLAKLAEGYIAYCGTYDVLEETQQVIHTPIIALLPNLLERAQLRTYTFDGQLLTLETVRIGTEGLPITARLVWRRYAEFIEGGNHSDGTAL
jgi:hypothetical protein